MSGATRPEGSQTAWRFKPYATYRDSGVEWLAEIPVHWEVKKLARLVDCLDGHRVPLNAGERGVMQGDYPYWGANCIVDYVDRWLFDEELVLLGEDGAPFFDRTKSVAFHVSGKIWVNNHAHVLRPRRSLHAAFLAHALNGVDYRVFIDGATRDKLTQGNMNSIAMQFPPIDEQRTIAAFLDRETARIDALVAKKERLIELLQEQRTALITRAVTKGLDAHVLMKDSGVEWLGEIPAHWEVLKTTWLFSIGSGTTPRAEDSMYYGGDIPWITTSELRESVVTSTEKSITELALREHSSLKVYPVRSVAVAMYGATIGRLGILGVPATVNQACCVFSDARGADSQFWFYWLQMRRPYLVSLGYGGGQPNLSQELLRLVRVPTPPLEEQLAIATSLRHESARLDALVAKIRDAIARLKELRTALISAAVTGKIDVREEVA